MSFNDLRRDIVVCFIDIGEIGDMTVYKLCFHVCIRTYVVMIVL